MIKRLQVRLITPSEVNDVCDLIVKTIDFSLTKDYLPETISKIKVFHNEQHIAQDIHDGADILVAFFHDEIVGTITLKETFAKRLFVSQMFQHQKIGSVLWNEIEQIALKKGLPFIEFYATVSTQAYYIKKGYTTMTLIYNHIQNTKVEYYRMIKAFQPCRSFIILNKKIFNLSFKQYFSITDTESFTFTQIGNLLYARIISSSFIFAELIGIVNDDKLFLSINFQSFGGDWTTEYKELANKTKENNKFISLDETLELIEK